MKLTKNFILSEFASSDGAITPDKVITNLKQLTIQLQIIRDIVGPIHINSGYRSPGHNKAIGGVSNSQHVIGKASDLKPLKVTPLKLYNTIIQLIKENKIQDGGVGLYDSFVHYDIGKSGRRWDNRKHK